MKINSIEQLVNDVTKNETGLNKTLTTRQLSMIAIGGAIGTGLFLGSGFTINTAGPAVVISYLLASLIILLMMFALSEMTVAHPVAGSFGVYAEKYISPLAGYTVRWSYWFACVLTIGTEAAATGLYMLRWYPHVPGYIWIVVFTAILLFINCSNVKNFGEFEYWFASIKVVAIIAFLVIGIIVVANATGNLSINPDISLKNYTRFDGFAPNGINGILVATFIALFSFLGVEMIAISAGEAKDPQTAVPRAVKGTIARLLIFYLFSLLLMLAIVPWKQAGTTISPFVKAFQMIGIPGAADIMNFVVLTAALSSINSMLYTSSRLMFSLSRGDYAPKIFGKLSKNGSPVYAILISAIGIFIAAVVNQLLPADKQFMFMVSLSLFPPLYIYLMIFISHLNFRKKWTELGGGELSVKLPFAPYSTWVGIILLSFITLYGCLKSFHSTLYLGIGWLVFLSVCYYFNVKNKKLLS